MEENKAVADIQSNKVRKKHIFKAKTFCSQSSKVLAFLSLQIHHTIQWGIAFQISICQWRPSLHCQQSNKSTTRFGITQCMPNKVKTVSHISLATVQWRNRWSMDSPSTLHIQHQLTRIMFCLRKLSAVKIFPSATVQIKKVTLGGTCGCQMHFHGNLTPSFRDKAL